MGPCYHQPHGGHMTKVEVRGLSQGHRGASFGCVCFAMGSFSPPRGIDTTPSAYGTTNSLTNKAYIEWVCLHGKIYSVYQPKGTSLPAHPTPVQQKSERHPVPMGGGPLLFHLSVMYVNVTILSAYCWSGRRISPLPMAYSDLLKHVLASFHKSKDTLAIVEAPTHVYARPLVLEIALFAKNVYKLV